MSVIKTPEKFDREAEVIVVGGGAAGLPAAIAVAEQGLKAMVLESRPKCSGSLAIGAGDFAIAGSDEQKEQGIEDSPDIFYKDMVDVCGADPELARAYVDNQIHAYRMLKQGGIKFPGIIPFPEHSRDRCLGWLFGMGPVMVKVLKDRAENKGAEILLRHRAIRLIKDPEAGRVIGLKVEIEGQKKSFKAKKAVILAAGGFGRNREMIAEYAPDMVDAFPLMGLGHQGDGLRMGLDVGAATKDIGIAVAPSFPVCIETHSNALMGPWYGGVMVNVNGKRFYNESCPEGYFGFMTGAGMRQPGGVYWAVFDNNILENIMDNAEKAQMKDTEECRQYNADTLEALAESAGMDANGLKETIDRYNGDVEDVGHDTAFHRKYQAGQDRPLIKIDTPPFHAIKCVTSTTSLRGGLRINARSQVLNQFNEVIPGLYAAGEVTGGLFSKKYLSGVMSSESMTFGIIAGRNAIKETPWQ